MGTTHLLALLLCTAAPAQVLDLLDGETLYDGGTLVSWGVELDRGEELRRGSDRIVDPTHGSEQRFRTTLAYQYGLRNDLQVGAALSYAELAREGDGVDLEGAGLGDLDLLGKWRFYRWDAPGVALNVAALGALSLPTGDDDDDGMGTRLEPELQPGSGGIDPAIGLGATHEPGRWRFNAAALYRWRTDTDDDGYEPGDEIVTELAIGNRFWLEPYPGPFMRADLAVRYEREAHSRAAGLELPSSGAERALLAVNLAFRPRPSLDLQLEVEAPFWQEVNGTQYGSDWIVRFTFGYRY